MPRSLAIAAAALAAFFAAPPAAVADAASDLHALFDREWERDLADNPISATYLGDARYNDRLPDVSPAAEAARDAADAKVLDDLARIPRGELPPAEQLNYDLFRHEYETRRAAEPFHTEYYGIEASGGPQSLDELAELVPFETVTDYETWIRRMRAIPAFLDQYGELLRRGAKEKRTQPRAVMERVLEPLAKQVVDKPEVSPFFERFRAYPDAIAPAERERLTAEAKQVIAESVIPAYRRFQDVFREEYLPATRETVGIWDTPDGRAYYEFLARYHTTTDLTPDEIHAIGLKEVARNRAEMQKVMDGVGFKGTLTDFFRHLRTDPRFYYETGDELFRAYAYIVKMIDPELPKLFGKLYRTPFGLRPIPDNSAPNTTTAYYQGPSLDGSRPGYYYVNLYRPEVRPKYEMEVLSVHEAAPGHHLQIALAQEQTDLPTFRRAGGYTAYVEGWGLYSERLGYDLGLYKDPYSRFGQLTYDQWRAVRLVVDTGLHYMKWTRQQAIDYFMANAAKTEADIVNEIDRYISDPGQALAYKIGQLKFLELRARAEQALGERFDIRAFHDTALATGAVPLDILERGMDAWIAAQKAK
ncbi:MAG TPA: DUF885 domain-containing protein [Steroidobacteraceae bacterium]|nr:DUF885 domain-containing protein [Steroidobacteraceae bacterium]